MTPAFDIQVNRKDFHQYKVVEKETPTKTDLLDGQILVKVDQFAFTANNITYAVVGEVVGYWKFFPVSDDWGIIPVWGFADVVASKNDAIKTGERFYGYYPMGSHLIMSPTKVKSTQFSDGIAHRVALPPIYNSYINTKMDPSYSREGEAIQSLFRPLFTTSFLIDDFMDDNNFFESDNILLTSASSKTAIGLAFLLSQRKTNRTINIIGLTSPRNVEFVKSLGYYDTVLTYDQAATVGNENKSVIVDFSGNDQLQQTLQSHLGAHLSYNCLVGMVDWTERGKSGSNKGTFFFAPSQFVKREKEWGLTVFQQKIGMAWMSFTGKIENWMKVENTKGAQGLASLYLPMLNGEMDPKVGYVVELD